MSSIKSNGLLERMSPSPVKTNGIQTETLSASRYQTSVKKKKGVRDSMASQAEFNYVLSSSDDEREGSGLEDVEEGDEEVMR